MVHQIERKQAIVYLLIAAMMWSSGGLLIKTVMLSPLAIAGTRSAIASLVILAFLQRPQFERSLAQIGGAFAYAGTVILFVAATKLTTAANAILLQFTAPVYIAMFSPYYLGEKIYRSDWAIIGGILGGMLLFFQDNLSSSGMWGNICGIASGFCFAWFTLFMRKQISGSPLTTVFVGNIITAILCLPFMFSQLPSHTDWIGLGLLGVFQLGIPYWLYAKAVTRLPALDTKLILMLEPILNPLWVLLIIGEKPGLWSLVGGSIILALVGLRAWINARRK